MKVHTKRTIPAVTWMLWRRMENGMMVVLYGVRYQKGDSKNGKKMLSITSPLEGRGFYVERLT